MAKGKRKQLSTKHTHRTKDRVTATPLKTGVNSGALEGWTVTSSLSGTSRVKLVTTPVISHGHKLYITKFCPSAFYMFVSRVLVVVVFCVAYVELIVEVEYEVEICYLPKLLMLSFLENQIR